ncbi:hypothetical protein BC828DRAFT_381236 [Blastocladiella britannica]|nr:hypothetical protein BC828DRAFT_381236 [Blastocladiella britannica]
MTLITLDMAFPTAAAGAKARAVAKPSAARKLPIDIASPRYHTRADPTDESALAALFGERTVDEFPAETDADDDNEAELDFLYALDPKKWKDQDHYRVLGLAHLRYQATPEDIKLAHRTRVLKYHPDKLAASAGGHGADAIFKCIAKAWEILSDPAKRRSFDSADKGVGDEIPSEAELKKWWDASPDEQFFPKLQTIFTREARFGKKPSAAPKIGVLDSQRNVVEGFYKYWYNFDSWRSFEYEDKEDEGADNRFNKRYNEAKNKSERQRKKNEDNARLRSLVDSVLKLDTRMKKFKEEDKLAKKNKQASASSSSSDAAPTAAASAAAAKAAEAEAVAAAAAAAEAEKAAQADAAKQAAASKKAAKELVKKEKKAIRQLVTKEYTYLSAAPTSSEMEKTLIDTEVLLESFKDDVERAVAVREALVSAAKAGGMDGLKAAFAEQVGAARA